MTANTMESTILALLAPGKGILAADESLPTIGKRFKALEIPSTEESRRAYRNMLVTTPGLSDFISGVILFDETIRQQVKSGVSIPQFLAEQGIVPGIKVDKGTISLPNFAGEKITQGLDALRERLIEYRDLGARFTKWRAVIAIGEERPTETCIKTNGEALALFAGLSQEAGLVPIVEPEVLMDGNHTLEQCEEVTTHTLRRIFESLIDHRVILEQMILKTGMILSGAECPVQSDLVSVAAATHRCLRRAVPAAVPGIVFLSGGQSGLLATQHLNAICKTGNSPWKLTFSFGRALQSTALELWKGSSANLAAAQAALHQSAQGNSLAVLGKYSER
jgi:fructose-bisphosphate aldolase class I